MKLIWLLLQLSVKLASKLLNTNFYSLEKSLKENLCKKIIRGNFCKYMPNITVANVLFALAAVIL